MPRPRQHCVRWGLSSPRKGAQQSPHFSAHVLWPNGRPPQQLLSSCSSTLAWVGVRIDRLDRQTHSRCPFMLRAPPLWIRPLEIHFHGAELAKLGVGDLSPPWWGRGKIPDRYCWNLNTRLLAVCLGRRRRCCSSSLRPCLWTDLMTTSTLARLSDELSYLWVRP